MNQFEYIASLKTDRNSGAIFTNSKNRKQLIFVNTI